ncbi:MAG: cation-translocating P-type ATPase C-terminal domain-containing protein [Coriobacteriia bacterium]|nr:cation-translocating P-type ATPase C-terminal domain-containing protein [Coriobacteriia bacterium]
MGAGGVGLLPLQLLWINLITDGLPALALGVDPAEHDVMRRRPRDASKPILTLPRWVQILSQGAVMTAVALLLAYVFAPLVESHAPGMVLTAADTTRTMLFAAIVLAELLHTLTFRSETKSVFSREVIKNKWLLAAIAGSFALQFLVIYVPGLRHLFQLTPLDPLQWGMTLAVAFVAMVVNDLIGLLIDKKMSGKE